MSLKAAPQHTVPPFETTIASNSMSIKSVLNPEQPGDEIPDTTPTETAGIEDQGRLQNSACAVEDLDGAIRYLPKGIQNLARCLLVGGEERSPALN